MDKSINRIELRGNVGQDPRINVVGENKVIKFTLATNEVFKERSGNFREETTWHNVTCWSGKGIPDFSAIKKGTCVSVTGRIRNNKYITADGEDKIFTEVLANRLRIENTESL